MTLTLKILLFTAVSIFETANYKKPNIENHHNETTNKLSS